MSFVATAIVGGSAIGGLISGNAAENAANTESQAAGAATAAQLSMFNTEQQDAQPYMQAGDQALAQINQNMPGWNAAATPTAAQVEATPGYQFQMQQTLANLGSSESAQGATYGTGTMAAMTNYANNVASTGYNQAFNNYQTSIQNAYGRLAGVAGMGAQTVAGLNSNATAVGANIGNNITSAGTASAAGTIGSAQAIGNSINTSTNGLMYNNMMSNLMQQQPTFQNPQGTTIGSLSGYNNAPGYSSTGYNGQSTMLPASNNLYDNLT